MKTVFYGIVLVFLKVLSLFPLWLLYGLSGFISFIFRYVYPYRKKVITENLANSFPEKSEQERKLIKTNFYRYFSVMLIESVKMISMSPEKLSKHISFVNPEYLEELYSKKKSVIAISAHYGNWEWLLGLRSSIPHESLAIYKPLNNRYFNEKMTRMRSGFGARLVSMREVPRVLFDLNNKGVPVISAYIADQSPVWEEIQYWSVFMNRQTPVYLGPEKLARKFDMAVVYFRMRIEGKGRYSVEIVPVTENPGQTTDYEITEAHLRLLEEDIKFAPEYWLWSHRRWKLTDKREREEAEGRFRFEGQFRKI